MSDVLFDFSESMSEFRKLSNLVEKDFFKILSDSNLSIDSRYTVLKRYGHNFFTVDTLSSVFDNIGIDILIAFDHGAPYRYATYNVLDIIEKLEEDLAWFSKENPLGYFSKYCLDILDYPENVEGMQKTILRFKKEALSLGFIEFIYDW